MSARLVLNLVRSRCNERKNWNICDVILGLKKGVVLGLLLLCFGVESGAVGQRQVCFQSYLEYETLFMIKQTVSYN